VIRRESSEQGLPPGRSLIISPYDTDARYSEKRGRGWQGYKVHLTETCHDPAAGDRAAPNLITHVATTAAAVTDAEMTAPVHDALDRRGLLPAEHLADSGYMSADLLVAARERGITLTGPLRAAVTPQARSGGHTAQAFTIDWDHRQVTCPAGTTSQSWTQYATRGGRDKIQVKFPAAACAACPQRPACTTSATGRQLGLRPRRIHDAVTAARASYGTDDWKHRYAARAGIEGTIAQAAHITGIRTARYTGLPRTTLEHAAAATALNLIRLNAWWTGRPLDTTRTTHLQRLHLTPAA
jgi:IS5 family transposase